MKNNVLEHEEFEATFEIKIVKKKKIQIHERFIHASYTCLYRH